MVFLIAAAWWIGGLTSTPVKEATGSANPATMIFGQLGGSVPVTAGQLTVFGLSVLALFAVAALLGWAAWRQTGGRSRVDDRATSMARVKDMDELTAKRQAADAERLGASGASEGVPLAKLVNNRKRLFASWEWVQLWIMGPRAGKTSCVCVPQILETKGPVVATSNKRDIVDLTRGPRSREGVVWVHDVQGIIGEPAS
ncbi:conjugative transfer gene complex protein [Brevibacterium yomogidense]|uniref:Conjugative transfer gene complex protein n=1 Tax=Brevibacterium yomogidense TaxID=946573 RepID=A0A1X6XP94_9MICO|nr:conjugative transfer gene complex protein [Brevibacterium yomogidense]